MILVTVVTRLRLKSYDSNKDYRIFTLAAAKTTVAGGIQ